MAHYKKFIKDIEQKNGVKLKVKGGEVGTRSLTFNYSLVILKKAIVNYFVEGKSIYDTINENQELIDYQIIKKRSSATEFINAETNEVLPDKVLRLFPVTEGGMTIRNKSGDKVPEVPDRIVLIKDNIQNMTIKDVPNLDINYYIQMFNEKKNAWTGESPIDFDENTIDEFLDDTDED